MDDQQKLVMADQAPLIARPCANLIQQLRLKIKSLWQKPNI